MKTLITTLLITLFSLSLAKSQGAKKQGISPRRNVPAKVSTTTAGEALYKQYCLTCHQVDGGGVPGLNPSLRGTEWVTGDKARLIGVLLNGLQNVEIDGETYDNVMPAHDFLTDAQLADLLTYLRNSFGNAAPPITPDEVKQQRALKK